MPDLSLARKVMKARQMAKGGEVKEPPTKEGGVCYACGGVVGMAKGGMVEGSGDDETMPELEYKEEEEGPVDDKEGFLRNFFTARSVRGKG